MADNVTTQATTLATIPSSTTIATDDSGGAHYQIVEIADATLPSQRLSVDASGRLTTVMDDVSATGNSANLTTATTLYTAGDQLGDIIALSSMASATGGSGWIGSLTLLCDKIGVIGSVRAWFFSASVTVAANNAAFAISDADMAKCVGTVSFPSPADATNASIATLTNVCLDYTCDATTLYVALETLSTHTVHFDAADDLHITARAYRL